MNNADSMIHFTFLMARPKLPTRQSHMRERMDLSTMTMTSVDAHSTRASTVCRMENPNFLFKNAISNTSHYIYALSFRGADPVGRGGEPVRYLYIATVWVASQASNGILGDRRHWSVLVDRMEKHGGDTWEPGTQCSRRDGPLTRAKTFIPPFGRPTPTSPTSPTSQQACRAGRTAPSGTSSSTFWVIVYLYGIEYTYLR